jgi:hypothetical protein
VRLIGFASRLSPPPWHWRNSVEWRSAKSPALWRVVTTLRRSLLSPRDGRGGEALRLPMCKFAAARIPGTRKYAFPSPRADEAQPILWAPHARIVGSERTRRGGMGSVAQDRSAFAPSPFRTGSVFCAIESTRGPIASCNGACLDVFVPALRADEC